MSWSSNGCRRCCHIKIQKDIKKIQIDTERKQSLSFSKISGWKLRCDKYKNLDSCECKTHVRWHFIASVKRHRSMSLYVSMYKSNITYTKKQPFWHEMSSMF